MSAKHTCETGLTTNRLLEEPMTQDTLPCSETSREENWELTLVSFQLSGTLQLSMGITIGHGVCRTIRRVHDLPYFRSFQCGVRPGRAEGIDSGRGAHSQYPKTAK